MSEYEKPHTSPSQINTYERCAEAFRRSYLEGDKIPPSVVMHIGSGVHAGDQHNFEQKILSHHDLPPSQIVDAAVAAMDARIDQDGLTLEAGTSDQPLAVAKARDLTAAIAMHHATLVLPNYQPVAVEQEFKIAIPKCSHDLWGVVDLECEDETITDFKTTGRKRSQAEADNSLQLTAYAVAFFKKHRRFPAAMRLDVTMRPTTAGTTPAHYVLETTRTAADVQVLVAHINAVTKGITSGNFPPAPQGAWYCSAKWCGYHSTCKYVKH